MTVRAREFWIMYLSAHDPADAAPAVIVFSERGTYVHVRYMLSAVRLSSDCLSFVMLVHPTQPLEIFGNFFHRALAQGL